MIAEKPKFTFDLQPVQMKLFEEYERSKKTRWGLGGARGGTKSHSARTLMLYRRMRYPNTIGYVIRKKYQDIRDDLITPLIYREHTWLRQYYKSMEKILRLPNNSEVRFISCPNDGDIFQLKGKEGADVIVDQAEQFRQDELEFATTINRCTTNTDITPKMLFSFNPGDVGHQYLKRIFVDCSYQNNENGDDYGFIETKGWDNGYWCEKYLLKIGKTIGWYNNLPAEERFKLFITESDYGRNLWQLDETQKAQQLYGSWDTFAGQFFEMWRRDLHYVEPIRPGEDWPIVGSIDYGSRTVMEIATMDPDGRVFFIAEHYSESQYMTERFEGMADVLIANNLFGFRMICDKNMSDDNKKYTGAEKLPIEIARDVFYKKMGENAPQLEVVEKRTDGKNNYRITANEAVKEYLRWKRGPDGELVIKPMMFVTHNCPWLASTIVSLVHDPRRNDGLDFDEKKGIDDPYDAAKYDLLALRKNIPRPKEEKVTTEEGYMEKYVFAKIRNRVLSPHKSWDRL